MYDPRQAALTAAKHQRRHFVGASEPIGDAISQRKNLFGTSMRSAIARGEVSMLFHRVVCDCAMFGRDLMHAPDLPKC